MRPGPKALRNPHFDQQKPETMRLTRAHVRSEKGQTMVEFAIIVPILLTILLGIVQLGIVYNNWVSITDAARAGARKGAVCRTGCTPDATTATVNVVKNSAADLNQSSLGVTVTSTWAQGADVTVKASYPWSVNIMGVVVASGTMTATTTERVE
jgi:Flp pilus assembly protein TadG